jgi:hypothetical protein
LTFSFCTNFGRVPAPREDQMPMLDRPALWWSHHCLDLLEVNHVPAGARSQLRRAGSANSTCVRLLLERHSVDDLAAFISDCNRPAGVVTHLMEQPTPEFRCCLVSGSLRRQRGRQIDTLIVPDKALLRAKVEVVARLFSLPAFETQTLGRSTIESLSRHDLIRMPTSKDYSAPFHGLL